MKKHGIVLGFVLLGLLSALSSAQAPVPFISQPLVPSAVEPGGAGYLLTLNGVGFVPTSVVDWNGAPLTTQMVSGSQVTATVSASDIAAAGTAWVTVVNPAPGGGKSNVVFSPVTVPTVSVGFRSTEVAAAYGSETVATGDFNGDGKLDLAVSNFGSGELSILLGNGDGTFRPHVDYPVESTPSTVVAGDFNGDGILDLAVFNEGSQSISILMGNGDGTFKAAVDYPTGVGGGRMVTADFNRDGKLDLAHTNVTDGTVSVLLGNGDGTFQKGVDYAVGTSPIGIAVGDLNGDGNLDLVAGNANGETYAVLLGNGDGTFERNAAHPTINNPQSVVLADFNGDGKLDLAVFSETSGTAGTEVLLGNGDGTFRSLVRYHTSCGNNVNDCTAATADLNGDGKLDLIVRNSPANTVQVLLGNGDGTFQNPLSFATGPNPEQVAVGDFDGDGRLDLVVANLGASFVSVLLQQAEGPTAKLSASNLDFGSQLIHTPSSAQKIILTNTGGQTLDISGIVVSANFLQNNNCGSTVLPGAKCTISVTFRPLSICAKTGTLTITDNAANSPQTVALSGVGTVVTLSATSLNFGNQGVGTTSSAQTVTLTNHATSRVVDIYNVQIKGGEFLRFSQTNTCGTGVAPGASCTFSVTFTPKFNGPKSSTLYIWNGGGDTPEQVTLSGDGT